MYINKRREPGVKSWLFRCMFGPACILDGIVGTVTLGYVNMRFSLWVARKLAFARISEELKNGKLKNEQAN